MDMWVDGWMDRYNEYFKLYIILYFEFLLKDLKFVFYFSFIDCKLYMFYFVSRSYILVVHNS